MIAPRKTPKITHGNNLFMKRNQYGMTWYHYKKNSKITTKWESLQLDDGHHDNDHDDDDDGWNDNLLD